MEGYIAQAELKKKALDYVSDYQLKSACKDAICIAPSKLTQMIFAVLEDWYHHVVLTDSYKLLSFFTYIWKMSIAPKLCHFDLLWSGPSCCRYSLLYRLLYNEYAEQIDVSGV